MPPLEAASQPSQKHSFRWCSGDAEPDEEVVDVRDGTTVGSGEGFNTLAGYLFGNNTQELAMDMTTPVNIDVSPVSGR